MGGDTTDLPAPWVVDSIMRMVAKFGRQDMANRIWLAGPSEQGALCNEALAYMRGVPLDRCPAARLPRKDP